MGLETGENDDIQASTVKQNMEQQKEKLENTNVRTQQGTSFNKEAVDNSMSNQLNLNQLLQLLDRGTPLVKEFFDFQKSKLDLTIKRDEKIGAHNRKLISSLLIFLSIVTGIMAFLTFLGKVSGDALLFLAGIIVGYVMTMIQGLLSSPFENEEEGS